MKTNELKCTDLRIGNFLRRNNKIVKVNGLSRNEVKYTDNDKGETVYDIMFFHPIELTEEVLLKIGFEERKGYFNYSKVFGDENNYCDSIHIYYCPRLKHFKFTHDKVKECDLQTMDLYNIKYLHELQNAYYCLTNEELNIEL